MANEQSDRRAGAVYGPLIASALSDESSRKASLEQRAVSVVTTSGVLVSLLAALTTLLLRNNPPRTLNVAPKALLICTLIMFVVAAVFALVANSPRDYRGFGDEDIDRMVLQWTGEKEEAVLLIADFQASLLKRTQRLNNHKAILVQWAIGLEVTAVGLLALTVALVLLT